MSLLNCYQSRFPTGISIKANSHCTRRATCYDWTVVDLGGAGGARPPQKIFLSFIK